LALAVIAALTVASAAVLWTTPREGKSLLVVWSYAWITAASTGLGALPFLVLDAFNRRWLGVTNALAAGMMMAASVNLLIEGMERSGLEPLQRCPALSGAWGNSAPEATDGWSWSTVWGSSHPSTHVASGDRAGLATLATGPVLGTAAGVVFMVGTCTYLEESGGVETLHGAVDPRRMLSVLIAMTVHSFSEGIAIGSSFCGATGSQLGLVTSASLAVHNVPEGIAISLALVPKGVSPARAAVWSVLSSVPQPLMAIPAYIFVEHFESFLPAALGFAAGAMLWVAIFDLLVEATNESSLSVALPIVLGSAYFMASLQETIEGGNAAV
jgi:zinc transporter ZupT